MSVIIGYTNDREGVLATDTLAVDLASDRRFEIAKSYTIPHLGAVYGVSGSALFAAQFLHEAIQRGCADFDALVDQLADVAFSAYQFGAGLYSTEGANNAGVLVLVGWSKAAGRPIAATATNTDDEGQVDPSGAFRVTADMRGVFAYPTPSAGWDAGAATRRRLPPDDVLIAIANAQRSVVREAFGEDGHMGGRLIRHKVTRRGIESATIHSWKEDLALLGGGAVEAERKVA